MAGLVRGPGDVEDFCRAKLLTSARIAAAFAAASARLLDAERPGSPALMAELDAELRARTPAEAARAASRQLGTGLIRLLRSVLPEAGLVTPWSRCPGPAPHHPLVLGAGVRLAGGTPELAAWAAALAACAAPASAAARGSCC